MRLCILHNLFFYNHLMERIRVALEETVFPEFYSKYRAVLDLRDEEE